MRISDWSSDVCSSDLLDTKDFQFLYAEGDDLVFMDKDSFEQINIGKDVVGEAHEFLQDGMEVVLELWDERPISVELPETNEDRKSVVQGKGVTVRVDSGGARIIKKKIAKEKKE